MKTLMTAFFLLATSVNSFGQNDFKYTFNHLVNKTWVSEGIWGNGGVFKQEVQFEYALDSTLVIANTKGFTDSLQSKFGERAYGIRKYDKNSNTINFWEFDIFGGITKGEIFIKDKIIYYQYEYGKSTITDAWKKIKDDEYVFKIGIYTNGTWDQVFLETSFVTKRE